MDFKCKINIKDEPLEGADREVDGHIYVMTGLQEMQVENCNSILESNEFEIKKEPLDIRMEESKNEETFNHLTEMDEKQSLYVGEGGCHKGERSSDSPYEVQIEEKRMDEKHNEKEEEEFICLKCNFIFESEVKWESHLESSCQLQFNKCSRCTSDCNCEESHLKTSLLNSENTDESILDGNFFTSSEGNCECNEEASLPSHLLTHENIFKCPECNRNFNHKRSLKRHLLTHGSLKLFHCSECNYECNRKDQFKFHKLNHQNIKLFKCPECSHECNEKGNFKRHLLTHVNIRLFKCPECNYECKEKGSLTRHLLTHGNIKLFQCSDCDYKCNRKAHLKVHMLKHQNIKLFKCSECNYECNLKQSLKRHILTHRRGEHTDVVTERRDKRNDSKIQEDLIHYSK